jgi:hypothetical protein
MLFLTLYRRSLLSTRGRPSTSSNWNPGYRKTHKIFELCPVVISKCACVLLNLLV